MVRKIEWTYEGRKSKLEILEYWTRRNKSNIYSRKLNKHFNDALNTIIKFPELGRPTENDDIKYILVSDFNIFYRSFPSSIHVLLIWDSRRNPNSLKYRK